MSEAERIKPSYLANKVTGIVPRDSTSADNMKITLTFAIGFEKWYNETPLHPVLWASWETWRALISCRGWAPRLTAYISWLVTKWWCTTFFSLWWQILTVTTPGSKSLSSTHSDYIRLSTATTKEMLILTRAANTFLKNPNMPAIFHGYTLFRSTKNVLGGAESCAYQSPYTL